MPALTRLQARLARLWMTVMLIGLLIFMVGIQPDLIGMNRSVTVGFVQIGVWLTGLAILLVAAYSTVRVIRNGKPTSLRADIGTRLIATGYVVAAVGSLADFIGVGAHRMPVIYFGPIQMIGLVTGVLLSMLGVILYMPWTKKIKTEERAPDLMAEMPNLGKESPH
ncbi:MAG: hypothetical protein KAR65_01060 [Anaerolineales bacterium]|nr:hypothetical protein [Anaerolineales bacterium]